MQNLTTVKLKAATANAIHAHPAGIVKGVDAQFTGAIERIDAGVLQSFLDEDILPVVPPLGFDADGKTLRVNSDAVAREVAIALGAAKILFLAHGLFPFRFFISRMTVVGPCWRVLTKLLANHFF